MSYEPSFAAVLTPVHLHMLADGLKTTLLLATLTIPLSVAFSLMLSVLRTNKTKLVRTFGHGLTEVLRNVPGVFWLLFWYFVIPVVVSEALGTRMNTWPHWALFSAVMGLSFNNAPYLSDVIYAGFSSVPRQAYWSARLSGLPAWPVWWKVILPTALLSTLPALNARLVHGFKNTSLAMLISVQDLAWHAQEIESLTFRGIEITSIITAMYVMLSLSLSLSLHCVDRHLRIKRRQNSVAAGTVQ